MRRWGLVLTYLMVAYITINLLILIFPVVNQPEHRIIEETLVRRKRPEVDCRKIIEYDEDEINKAKLYMKVNPLKRYKDEEFINKTQDCESFRHDMHYNILPISKEEKDFPLAFSILTYADVDQTERLLRAIYRRHNFYCIHVDRSSPEVVHKALEGISRCLENVFIVSKAEDVIYEHMSRLQADLNCMSDLLNISKKWKYFINLPHQQFPLKTNLEIVKILKLYNGSNDIEGIISHSRIQSRRYKYVYEYLKQNRHWKSIGKRNMTMPYGVRIVKGSAYGIFSRKFVQFIIRDEKAKHILKFMEGIRSPDEYYWATLNHNNVLAAPGQYTGNPEEKPWHAAYASWAGSDRCHGKFVRYVCVFGLGDLNKLVSRKELFANKFYMNYQYLALDCLEEYIFNRSFSSLPFETFYYKQLPFRN